MLYRRFLFQFKLYEFSLNLVLIDWYELSCFVIYKDGRKDTFCEYDMYPI